MELPCFSREARKTPTPKMITPRKLIFFGPNLSLRAPPPKLPMQKANSMMEAISLTLPGSQP